MTENLKSAAVSDRGLSEKRPHNEDSFLKMPECGLFAVADGVGGAQAGEVASQMAMEILQEAFNNLNEGGDAEDLMRRAIERANEAIFQMSNDLPQLSSMATTVVALHVDGNIATIGHVGDSRLYRIDPNGNLYRETNDHSIVEEEVRAGRMTPAQAATHPSRNIISRALGAENTVEIDLKTIMIEPNTTFLLCSDGITRHIEDHELRQLLNSGDAPDKICEDMKHLCYGRGAEDNLTAVVVQVAETAALAASEADTEEQTVAAVRPPLVRSGVLAGATVADSAEIPTQNLEMPVVDDFQTRESLGASKFSIPANEAAEETGNGNFATVAAVSSTPEATPAEEKVHTPSEQNGGGFFGKLVSSLVLLLIGAALGAGGYYYWLKSQPQTQPVPVVQETPQITQMQTPDIAYSAFEDNRRNVDKNPQQFIAANGNIADDAEDYYLLGRAYLLSGKYVEAKNAFVAAKSRLSEYNGADKAMLVNEIAIGLSIVDSTFSKRVLEAERNSAGTATQAPPASNTNITDDTEIKPLNEQPQTGLPQVQ